MAKNEDACMINLAPYSGMRFVDISKNHPYYCDEVRSVGLLTTNRVNEEGSALMAHRRYISLRFLKIDTPEVGGELEMGDIGAGAPGDFDRSTAVCSDSRGLISKSKEQQFARNIR